MGHGKLLVEAVVSIPSMPEGVEHMERREKIRQQGIVSIPSMPEGVEHIVRRESILLPKVVSIPSMPEGVEHMIVPDCWARLASEHSFDAGRR